MAINAKNIKEVADGIRVKRKAEAKVKREEQAKLNAENAKRPLLDVILEECAEEQADGDNYRDFGDGFNRVDFDRIKEQIPMLRELGFNADTKTSYCSGGILLRVSW